MRSPLPVRFALLLGLIAALTPIRAELPGEVPMKGDADQETLVYVGTNTGPKSKGIYLYRLQAKNDVVSQNILLVPMGLAAEAESPTFLALDVKRRLVFAVNEVDKYQGKAAGAVSSFSIDPKTGKLALLSQQSSMGSGPCQVVLDKTGQHLLVANYSGGSVAVLPVSAEGKIGPATCFVQHQGKSVNPQRQSGPHAHCVTLDAANKFAFVCDLGLDKVIAYHFDAEHGTVTADDALTISTKPGAGPRHMVFCPDGKYAYIVNELNSTVSAYAYEAATGKLTELQTESTLPPYFDGPNTAAEVAVHPSGKWLYVSNRGNETVVLFDIDRDSGKITYTEEQNTGGKKPRHFSLQPSAKHMAIANQGSDNLLVTRVDDTNGRLKPSGVFSEAPSPTCAVFLPPARPGDEKPVKIVE
jgi:6-phosphogluconolactonase